MCSGVSPGALSTTSTWINAPVPHQPGCATKSVASATGDCLALACHDGPKIWGQVLQ